MACVCIPLCASSATALFIPAPLQRGIERKEGTFPRLIVNVRPVVRSFGRSVDARYLKAERDLTLVSQWVVSNHSKCLFRFNMPGCRIRDSPGYYGPALVPRSRSRRRATAIRTFLPRQFPPKTYLRSVGRRFGRARGKWDPVD